MKAANRKNVVAKNDLLICAKNDVNSHPVSTYRDCSVARLFSCGISNISGFWLTASARPWRLSSLSGFVVINLNHHFAGNEIHWWCCHADVICVGVWRKVRIFLALDLPPCNQTLVSASSVLEKTLKAGRLSLQWSEYQAISRNMPYEFPATICLPERIDWHLEALHSQGIPLNSVCNSGKPGLSGAICEVPVNHYWSTDGHVVECLLGFDGLTELPDSSASQDHQRLCEFLQCWAENMEQQITAAGTWCSSACWSVRANVLYE